MKIDEFKLNDDIKIEYAHYIEYKEEIKELEERKKDLIKYKEKLLNDKSSDNEEIEIIEGGIKIYQDNINSLKNKYGRNITEFFKFLTDDIEEVLLMLANIMFDDNFKIDCSDYVVSIINDDKSKKYTIYDRRKYFINYLEYSSSYNCDSFKMLDKFIIDMINYRISNNIATADRDFCMNYLKIFIKNSSEFIRYNRENNIDINSYIEYKLNGKNMIDSYPKRIISR